MDIMEPREWVPLAMFALAVGGILLKFANTYATKAALNRVEDQSRLRDDELAKAAHMSDLVAAQNSGKLDNLTSMMGEFKLTALKNSERLEEKIDKLESKIDARNNRPNTNWGDDVPTHGHGHR